MKVLCRLYRDVLYVCHLQLPRDKSCRSLCRAQHPVERGRGREEGSWEGQKESICVMYSWHISYGRESMFVI